ncbi:MAG: MFS transporter [Thermoplasmata archaeon]
MAGPLALRPRPFSFLRLSAATWLAYTSYGVLLALLPFSELNEGGGPLLATLVVGAPLLSQTLASYGWGWLSDRWGRRRELLAVGLALQAPLFLLLPVVGPVGLLGDRIAQSALFGVVVLATTLATEDTGASSAVRLGRLQLALNGGMLLGVAITFPLLVGAGVSLSSAAGWELTGTLAALAVAAGAVGALSGDLRRDPAPAEPGPPVRRGALAPLVVALAALTALVATFRYTAVTAIPVELDRILSVHGFFGVPANAAEQLALWLAVSSAVNLVVSPISGRLSDSPRSRRWTLGISAAVYGGLWTALAISPTYGVAFAVWSFPVAVFFQVAGIREAAALGLPEARGRTVGLLTAAFNSGGLFGAAIAGSVLTVGASFPAVYALAAAGNFAVAVALAQWIRRLPAAGPVG